MRIYYMLSYDVIFKPTLLHQLLLQCPGVPIGVAEVKQKKSENSKGREIGAYSFWGLKGLFHLSTLIAFRKACSALPFNNYLRCRSTIKRTCRFFEVPYDLVDDVNSPEYVRQLNQLRPDIIVSFQHQLFKKELLKSPRIACINCHPAKLPKFRGVKPIFWAMMEQESEIGVTVHSMEEKIDVGRILEQRCFPLLNKSTLFDNYLMAYSISSDVINGALRNLIDNPHLNDYATIPPSSRYYHAPRKEDMRLFLKAGNKII